MGLNGGCGGGRRELDRSRRTGAAQELAGAGWMEAFKDREGERACDG